MITRETRTVIAAAVLLPLLLGGCLNDLFEKRKRTYDGPDVVEFYPTSQTLNESNQEMKTVEVEIQLIGPQRESASEIAYSVDGEATTAEEGTHFRLATTSPATIPSGSSHATVELEIPANTLPEDETRTVVLRLEGGSGIEAADNYDTFSLTLRGQ